MPIFRYHCNACGRELELLVARFDSPAECPLCGSSDLENFRASSRRSPRAVRRVARPAAIVRLPAPISAAEAVPAAADTGTDR